MFLNEENLDVMLKESIQSDLETRIQYNPIEKLLEMLYCREPKNSVRFFWLSSALLVLRYLIINKEATSKDLENLGLSSGTLYRTLARLRDLELIEKIGKERNGKIVEGRPTSIWRIR